jgi:5,10-methylenetetrahydromethanopterin reductase
MKFSLRLNNDLPVARYPELARAAEQAGFDQLWVSDDLFLRGVWPILSACAVATSRIELGSCIVNPYTMHPAEIAMQAAALDELSGGRFNLGLAAGAADFLGWVRIPQDRPLAATASAARALRALFAGERAPEGWAEEAYLRFPTRRIPVYLGATSPRMQRLIGEVADGGLPLLFPPEHYAEVRRLVAEGASAAGRSADAIDLAACIWVSVSEDRAAAEDALREKIAYYGHAMGEAVLSRLGVAPEQLVPAERAVQLDGDVERAKALVPARMLRLGIAGSGRDLRERLAGLVALGARHLSFGPPLGPDPLAAIAVIGREVIPHFR